MNIFQPKPLGRQNCATDLSGATTPAPKKDEGDLAEIAPEPEEPKFKLADLINDTLGEGGAAIAKIDEGQATKAIPLTQPTTSLGIPGKPEADSKLPPPDQLRLAAWMVAGVILRDRLRFMGRDLLGVMLVSKELKAFALDTPNKNLDNEMGPKIKIDPDTVKRRIRKLRDGLYLVLRLDNAEIFVLGGKRAEAVDGNTVELAFKGIPNTRGFFKASDDIEKSGP